METSLTTLVLQAAVHVITKSLGKSTVSSALPKSSLAMETALPTLQLYSFDDVDKDLPITCRPGWLCQEGIDDTQALSARHLRLPRKLGTNMENLHVQYSLRLGCL